MQNMNDPDRQGCMEIFSGSQNKFDVKKLQKIPVLNLA